MENDLKHQGYSKEEEYFHKLNQTLIEKMKKDEEDTLPRDEENQAQSKEVIPPV